MARISKADHPKILHMVDIERRKVPEVAVEFGVSPAAMYTLVGKLRRATAMTVPADVEPEAAAVVEQSAKTAPDLFAAAAVAVSEEHPAEAAAPIHKPVSVVTPIAPPAEKPATAAPPPAASEPAPANPTPANPALGNPALSNNVREMKPAGRGGVGAKAAKPGYGLVMRTSEGEDSMTPFRSLDDLLSAVKPILRAAVRSPEAVWFSIQQVDLSTIEFDAA